MPRPSDSRGQTGAEYMGVLLLVAVVIATLGHVGVASAVAGGVKREVCRIAGGGECPQPSAADGPELPGAPDSGPAFGSVPYSGAGIPWDGSIELTVGGGASAEQGPFTGGAWVRATISEDRSACRLNENGDQIVRLGVKGTLKAGVTRGASGTTMGGSEDAYSGRSIGWQVATDEDTADAIVGGTGRLPTPVDPTTIPQGTAITLNEDYFKGLTDKANYSLLKVTYDIRHGKRLSSSVLRTDANHVRITVGDAKLVEASTFPALGGPDFGIGLATTTSSSDGRARQIDIDISAPRGRQAYSAFVGSGTVPDPQPPFVSGRRDSTVSLYSQRQQPRLELGPLTLSGESSDLNVKSVRTLRPDGRFDVMTYDQDNDVSLVGTTIENADGTFTPADYTMRLQSLPGSYAGLVQRDQATGDSRDVTLHYTSADLMRLHDMALDQVVYDAHRNGVDLTPAQAQAYLAKGPVAGSDVAQGLARQTTPTDVVNYLNQQVARGNAAGFVDALARFRQDSLDEGHADAEVFPGAAFKAPAC
jgi:hypothetical protein